jgi:hypothetical protein
MALKMLEERCVAMGIELSNMGTVEPAETAVTARTARTDESLVSDWASILNSLFQIDQPEEETSEPAVKPEAEPSVTLAPTVDPSFFWIRLPVMKEAEPVVESGVTTALNESIESLAPVATVAADVGGSAPEEDSGYELSGESWTVLPVPVALPTHVPAIPANDIGIEQDVADSPIQLHDESPSQPPRATPPIATPGGPTTVEASFRLSPEMTKPLKTNPPDGGERTTIKAESPLQDTVERAEGQIGDAGSSKSLDLNQQRTGADSQRPHSDSREQHASPESEPDNQMFQQRAAPSAETTPFSPPSHPSLAPEMRQSIARTEESVSSSALIENSAYPLTLEKRSSPLNFQVKVTADDLGVQNAGKQPDVRLNLYQRGDELLMRIQGGGDPVAIRAEAEWGTLVDRLKPHGIEALHRHFPAELGRRDDDHARPIAPENTAPDSDGKQEEGQQRFQQQHHERQQQQHHQRHLTRFAAGKSRFSLDYGAASPQGS